MAERTAEIIAFPQDRNIGKARHVASVFLKRVSDRDRQSYWRRVVQSLRDQFLRNGLDEQETNRQIDIFRSAVQSEVYRIEGKRNQPGGTA